MLRKLINQHILETVSNPQSVAILSSGGMDSLTLVLSCLDLGIKPVLYTFYLKSHLSEDLKSSRQISETFRLKLVEIMIDDTHIQQLEDDVVSIIKQFHVKKKTAIQCIYPFLYVAPQIQEEFVLTGLCADDLYGTPRSMAKHASNLNTFNALRDKRSNDESASSYLQIKSLFESYGKVFVAPYKENKDILTLFKKMTYKEMNSPKQKLPAYLAYKQEIEEYGLYRRNSNLQCGSMIREWHDQLLTSPLNKINAKTIVALYNNIYRSLH